MVNFCSKSGGLFVCVPRFVCYSMLVCLCMCCWSRVYIYMHMFVYILAGIFTYLYIFPLSVDGKEWDNEREY